MNRWLENFISLHGKCLGKRISDRELNRLRVEVAYLDFRAVPIDIAFRRFSARVGDPMSSSDYFCKEYQRANPELPFRSWEQVSMFLYNLRIIDDYFHRSKDSNTSSGSMLDFQIRLLGWEDALADAVGKDDSIDAVRRYEKLIESLPKRMSRALQPHEFVEMFERMRATRLVTRAESVDSWPMPPVGHASMQALSYVLRDIICLPEYVCGFWVLAVTSSVRAKRILHRFEEVGNFWDTSKLEMLAWAALLEEVELLWL